MGREEESELGCKKDEVLRNHGREESVKNVILGFVSAKPPQVLMGFDFG